MARALLALSSIALLLATTSGIPPSHAQGDELEVITWAKADSPIVLNGTIEIPEDAVLEIEAGVEIRLDRGSGIEVRGELRAVGTRAEPIRFVPNVTGVPLPAWWGEVRLHSLPDGRCHTVTWASFEGADAGLLLGSANATVEHCVFRACRYGVIARAESLIEVMNSTFSNNSAVGLELESGADGLIWNCTFEGNVAGVYCFEGSSPLIWSCEFTANYHHLSFARGSNATIFWCHLNNSIAEHFECYWNSSPLFEEVSIADPGDSRVFLREGCRPRFVGGTLVSSLRVDGTDEASYAIALMRITVLVKSGEGRRLVGANVTIVGASGDVMWDGTTLADGTNAHALMANFTHSSSGGLDRENPQNVTVEWRGYVQTFYVDPRDLNANNVLVLELQTGQSEPKDDLLLWALLLLAVVVLAAGGAVAVRRRGR